MIEVKLSRQVWWYDDACALGKPGGFGAVFLGRDRAGQEVAVKKLHVHSEDAGHRELRIGDSLIGRTLANVLPVLDVGMDANSDCYFIVMPRAEYNLQDYIDQQGRVQDSEAIAIMGDIVSGLIEVKDITHRDLKPANVLFHDGQWKIADFGIARFVEDATSANTLKDFLSCLFAAPEQFTGGRATSATDLYALGCIAYTLLTGHPPFRGTYDEVQRAHLSEAPPELSEDHFPGLRNVISMLLRKRAESRPSAIRVAEILETLRNEPSRVADRPGHHLASVAARLSANMVESQAHEEMKRNLEQNRKGIASSGVDILEDIFEELAKQIHIAAPNADFPKRRPCLLSIKLGSAQLDASLLDLKLPLAESAFERTGWGVVAGAVISVSQTQPRKYEWSSNLWYVQMDKASEYRWIEASYMAHPLLRSHPEYEPYAVSNPSLAGKAQLPGMAEIQYAMKPKFIDDENVIDFVQRWISLFSQAVDGGLRKPSQLPIE